MSASFRLGANELHDSVLHSTHRCMVSTYLAIYANEGLDLSHVLETTYLLSNLLIYLLTLKQYHEYINIISDALGMVAEWSKMLSAVPWPLMV